MEFKRMIKAPGGGRKGSVVHAVKELGQNHNLPAFCGQVPAKFWIDANQKVSCIECLRILRRSAVATRIDRKLYLFEEMLAALENIRTAPISSRDLFYINELIRRARDL